MGNAFCRSRKNKSSGYFELEKDIYIEGSMKYLEMVGMDLDGSIKSKLKNTKIRHAESLKIIFN